jgi:hypothetical protein
VLPTINHVLVWPVRCMCYVRLWQMRCIHHRYSMINTCTTNWFECNRLMERPKINLIWQAYYVRRKKCEVTFTQIYIMFKAEQIIRQGYEHAYTEQSVRRRRKSCALERLRLFPWTSSIVLLPVYNNHIFGKVRVWAYRSFIYLFMYLLFT